MCGPQPDKKKYIKKQAKRPTTRTLTGTPPGTTMTDPCLMALAGQWEGTSPLISIGICGKGISSSVSHLHKSLDSPPAHLWSSASEERVERSRSPLRVPEED